eukprot:scaffold5013_cov273-Pinguiococcus_pyrenoidosus.AAC.3
MSRRTKKATMMNMSRSDTRTFFSSRVSKMRHTRYSLVISAMMAHVKDTWKMIGAAVHASLPSLPTHHAANDADGRELGLCQPNELVLPVDHQPHEEGEANDDPGHSERERRSAEGAVCGHKCALGGPLWRHFVPAQDSFLHGERDRPVPVGITVLRLDVVVAQ